MSDLVARDKPFEADDPMELVPVTYPSAADEAADRETARCLVEEFALLGWSRAGIGELFRSPHYLAMFSIFRRRGAAFVDSIVADVLGSEGGQ